MGQSSQPHELGGGLKSRHVTMLSIAGVIGASLFVGSSVAIAEAGPAGVISPLFSRVPGGVDFGGITGLSVRRATGGYDYADVGGNGGCHARYRFVFHLCR